MKKFDPVLFGAIVCFFFGTIAIIASLVGVIGAIVELTSR